MNDYTFRDNFTTATPAGSVNGSAATPGVGDRVAVDVESKTSIVTSENRLTLAGQASAAWGDQTVTWPAITRATGRCLVGMLDIGDQDNVVAFGLANAAITGDPANTGHGFVGDGKRIAFISDLASTDQYIEPSRGLRPLEHLIAVVCNDIGAIVLASTIGDTTGLGETETKVISQYPDARIIWVDYQDITASLTPFISSASASANGVGDYLRDVRIVDVDSWSSADFLAAFSDRFTRDDSALLLGNSWTAHSGVWGISSNQAYQVSGAGRTVASHATTLTDGNAIWHWKFTMPSGQVEFPFRLKDANNYIFIYATNTAIGLYKLVTGSGTLIANTAITLTAGVAYDLTVISQGNDYRVFVDGKDAFNVNGVWTADTGSSHLNETRIGIGAFGNPSGELFDNVACYPLETSLPDELRQYTVPRVIAGVDILATDTFTDSNDVRLNAHTAEAGGAWTEHAGTWTVQSGNASLSGAVDGFVTQDLSATDAECQVVITTPGSGTTFYAGIAARYVDANNVFFIRIFMNPSQPASDEIEFRYIIGGSTGLVRKLNLGDYFATSTSYTLKVQCLSNWIYVWLDGQPICSYQTVSTDPAGTRFGLYRDGTNDAGCVFDSWSAKGYDQQAAATVRGREIATTVRGREIATTVRGR